MQKYQRTATQHNFFFNIFVPPLQSNAYNCIFFHISAPPHPKSNLITHLILISCLVTRQLKAENWKPSGAPANLQPSTFNYQLFKSNTLFIYKPAKNEKLSLATHIYDFLTLITPFLSLFQTRITPQRPLPFSARYPLGIRSFSAREAEKVWERHQFRIGIRREAWVAHGGLIVGWRGVSAVFIKGWTTSGGLRFRGFWWGVAG